MFILQDKFSVCGHGQDMFGRVVKSGKHVVIFFSNQNYSKNILVRNSADQRQPWLLKGAL